MSFVDDLSDWIERQKKEKYARGGIETIELIKSKFGIQGFALGNVVKYVTRYPLTGKREDLLKAGHYLAMVYEGGEERITGYNSEELLKELIRRGEELDCPHFIPKVGCLGKECVDWERCSALPKKLVGGRL